LFSNHPYLHFCQVPKEGLKIFRELAPGRTYVIASRLADDVGRGGVEIGETLVGGPVHRETTLKFTANWWKKHYENESTKYVAKMGDAKVTMADFYNVTIEDAGVASGATAIINNFGASIYVMNLVVLFLSFVYLQ